jgi:hypothetical protein
MWIWNLFNCYLSRRHDYGMWCEDGRVFLRCPHCGKRTIGWAVTEKAATAVPTPKPLAPAAVAPATTARVVPFTRAIAS